MMFWALICSFVVAVILGDGLVLSGRVTLLSAAIFGGTFWGFFLFKIWTGKLEYHDYKE